MCCEDAQAAQRAERPGPAARLIHAAGPAGPARAAPARKGLVAVLPAVLVVLDLSTVPVAAITATTAGSDRQERLQATRPVPDEHRGRGVTLRHEGCAGDVTGARGRRCCTAVPAPSRRGRQANPRALSRRVLPPLRRVRSRRTAARAAHPGMSSAEGSPWASAGVETAGEHAGEAVCWPGGNREGAQAEHDVVLVGDAPRAHGSGRLLHRRPELRGRARRARSRTARRAGLTTKGHHCGTAADRPDDLRRQVTPALELEHHGGCVCGCTGRTKGRPKRRPGHRDDAPS